MSLAGGFKGGAVPGVTGEKGCPDGIEGKSLKQRKSKGYVRVSSDDRRQGEEGR